MVDSRVFLLFFIKCIVQSSRSSHVFDATRVMLVSMNTFVVTRVMLVSKSNEGDARRDKGDTRCDVPVKVFF